MFSKNESKVEDLGDRVDLRKSPVNELVELVFQINFYCTFFLSLQHRQNLIPVLHALYVFTDEQLDSLKAYLDALKPYSKAHKESKEENDLQGRISLLESPADKLTEIVFEDIYGEENFLADLRHKRNLLPVLRALFVFTDEQLTCLQRRLTENKEKQWKPASSMRP
jgi:hypothetical protein